jgi:D-alanyl-D-alanine dipeptidase
MLTKTKLFIIILLLPFNANALPYGFVFLKDIDPNIIQDLRYKANHNFIGRPIAGYSIRTECVLTKPAAEALHQIQLQLSQHLSLKVYDCYRPQRAVNNFITWSKIPNDQIMKAEFYPRTDKAKFFDLGYVAAKSSHTRGSTVDLTITSIPASPQIHHLNQPLVACFAPYHQRFYDGSIDMGTGFDCMDETAHPDNIHISTVAFHNRMLLRKLMMQQGFIPYAKEWWHFTLKNEPYPDTYFNFLAQR